MALHWSVTGMKNYDVLTTFVESTGNRKWHPVTEAIVWATMSVGINEITESNWREFYERLHMKECITGPSLIRGESRETNFVTPAEVYMHIGMHTNASNKTRNEFLKELFEWNERDTKVKCDKAPDLYKELELESISEEDFQKSMRVVRFDQWASIETMVERTKKGWTPEHEDGYLLGTTENIGSTVDN